jgi:hypothetical protein
MTKWSPSRRALVAIEPASEPWSGSVSAKAAVAAPLAMRGSHSCRCSSVPL